MDHYVYEIDRFVLLDKLYLILTEDLTPTVICLQAQERMAKV